MRSVRASADRAPSPLGHGLVTRGMTAVLVCVVILVCMTLLSGLATRLAATTRVDGWFLDDRRAEKIARSAVEEAVSVLGARGALPVQPGQARMTTLTMVPLATTGLAASVGGPREITVRVEDETPASGTGSFGLIRLVVRVRGDGRTRTYVTRRMFYPLPGSGGPDSVEVGREDLLWSRE